MDDSMTDLQEFPVKFKYRDGKFIIKGEDDSLILSAVVIGEFSLLTKSGKGTLTVSLKTKQKET
jgi:hypothetical protein